MTTPGGDTSNQGVTLWANQAHVSRRLAALLGDPEPVLSGPTWVDELYETLAEFSPPERAALRAVVPGVRGDLSVDTALQRGRTPWLPAMLDDGDLYMAYQPIVDLHAGTTVAYEALVRGSLDGEEMAGHQIVAAAHAHDRVRQLDEATRTMALTQAAGALGEGERLVVNFDPMSVYDPEMCLRNTWATARRVGIGIEQVCFEIVDPGRCPDLDFLRRVIERFRAEGASVALQNLGAERTGVNFLRELRPDIVKLDRRLTSGLEHEDERRRLVGAMIDYAHELGTTVGVVGIETDGDLRCASEMGAELGQGFHLAPPSTTIAPAGTLAVAVAVAGSTPETPDTEPADPFAGLLGRAGFIEHVDMLVTSGRSVSVLLLELDAFERIAELIGKDAGDQVLVAVTESLLEQVGGSGTVARPAGHRFLVALDDARSADEAARFGRHLAEAIEDAVRDAELPAPQPRFAVAAAGDGESAAELLAHAEAALQSAERPLTRP